MFENILHEKWLPFNSKFKWNELGKRCAVTGVANFKFTSWNLQNYSVNKIVIYLFMTFTSGPVNIPMYKVSYTAHVVMYNAWYTNNTKKLVITRPVSVRGM